MYLQVVSLLTPLGIASKERWVFKSRGLGRVSMLGWEALGLVASSKNGIRSSIRLLLTAPLL